MIQVKDFSTKHRFCIYFSIDAESPYPNPACTHKRLSHLPNGAVEMIAKTDMTSTLFASE